MELNNLTKAKFIKRYKRFFADCRLENGDIITAHCPNSGSMKSLLDEGNTVWIEYNDDPKRKLRYKLHLMRVEKTQGMACINTMLPNKIVFDAVKNKEIAELNEFEEIKSEVKYGKENSRIDIWLKDSEKETFIEVKNVTLMEEDETNIASFPDAVTTRGAKHLRELTLEVEKGNRAVMLYLVNRDDCNAFKIAKHIDKKYKEEFDKAVNAGVEVLIYQTKIEIDENNYAKIKIDKKLELLKENTKEILKY